MDDSEERLKILQQIEDGAISASEGLQRLNDLAEASEAPIPPGPGAAADAAAEEPIRPDEDAGIRYWRRWWLIPLSIGIGVTVLSGLFMYWAVQRTGIGFWFLCSWLPLTLGLLLTALAAGTSRARWVHVRVDTGQTEWPQRIAISLPIPLSLVAWLIRAFGGRIPAAQRTALDDLLVVMDETRTPDQPIYIEVNEGNKGERVQVYIG